MPNESAKTPLLVAIELLVALLGPDERGRLRGWILARFDARGYPHRPCRGPDER
jgi:hypothetical protein